MSALSLSLSAQKPLNRWDYDSIRPGVVGSVGSCNITSRLKSTFPGDFRWDETYYGKNASLYGSSVSDGTKRSFNSGGGPARTIDSNWGGRRGFKTNHGWVHQDLRVPDKRLLETMGTLGTYDWNNKIAQVVRAQTTGFLFPIPAGGILQAPNGITRGGNYPTMVESAGGDVVGDNAGLAGLPHAQSGLTSPNFHPAMSSFGGPTSNITQNSNRSMNQGGAPGRLHRRSG